MWCSRLPHFADYLNFLGRFQWKTWFNPSYFNFSVKGISRNSVQAFVSGIRKRKLLNEIPNIFFFFRCSLEVHQPVWKSSTESCTERSFRHQNQSPSKHSPKKAVKKGLYHILDYTFLGVQSMKLCHLFHFLQFFSTWLANNSSLVCPLVLQLWKNTYLKISHPETE